MSLNDFSKKELKDECYRLYGMVDELAQRLSIIGHMLSVKDDASAEAYQEIKEKIKTITNKKDI